MIPLLPSEPVGWSSVKVLAASAPVLFRASEREREAIVDWVRTGGSLLVFPRSDHDLSDRWLRELAGSVETLPLGEARRFVPPGGYALRCSAGQREEDFGCSKALGFGRVFLAGYDGMSAAAVESGAPRHLVRAIYGTPEPRARLRFGIGGEQLDDRGYGPSSFGLLRAALDPNEGFRPALLLVALALLVYVIVVGPLNFGWVQKKNRPVLALVTTPLIALGCMLVLVVVGYVGKGVSMRYRRFEIVELVEGQTRAGARRYTGLFSTRPGSYDLPVMEGAARRVDPAGDRGPTYHHDGDRVELRDFHTGLWETVFLREDRMIELGGAIRFERDGDRLATVVNDSPLALTDAFVVTSDSKDPLPR